MKKFIYIIIGLVIFSNTLFAQWQKISGPAEGKVNSLCKSGSSIFCGTEGGLFYSTNEGITWTHSPKK